MIVVVVVPEAGVVVPQLAGSVVTVAVCRPSTVEVVLTVATRRIVDVLVAVPLAGVMVETWVIVAVVLVIVAGIC